MSEQTSEQSIYGADALVSDGTLTEAEVALLENDATIMDNGAIVDVTVNSEDEEPIEESTEGTQEESTEESKNEIQEETPAEALTRAKEALGEITDDLSTKGVDVDALLSEFSTNGSLTEESYSKLAEAGYSKTVVNSIIAGQRAAVEAFNNELIASVGGIEAFKQVAQFASTNSPSLVTAYNAAVDRGDAATATAILQVLSKERTAKLGTANKQLHGKPAAPAPQKPAGFASEDEMVKAINDRRYRIDPKYTKEVEQKIIASKY